MTDTEIAALKAAFTRLANERIVKWEGLRNEGMVVRAKADATTGFAMLCNAIEAVGRDAPAAAQESDEPCDNCGLGHPSSNCIYKPEHSEHKPDWFEQFIIDNRIAITPEHEGGFHAAIYRDEAEPVVQGYGSTPHDAINEAIASSPRAAEWSEPVNATAPTANHTHTWKNTQIVGFGKGQICNQCGALRDTFGRPV